MKKSVFSLENFVIWCRFLQHKGKKVQKGVSKVMKLIQFVRKKLTDLELKKTCLCKKENLIFIRATQLDGILHKEFYCPLHKKTNLFLTKE